MEEGDFSRHRKISRSKKWSKVFAESVKTRAPIEEKKEVHRGENMTVYFAKSAVAKKIHELAKVKLYQRSFSCKRTIENLKPPSELVHYDEGWKVSTLCDVCMKPALNDSIICNYCDIIVHIGCHEISPEESAFGAAPTPSLQTLKTPKVLSPKLLTPKGVASPKNFLSTPKAAEKKTKGRVLTCKNCLETQKLEGELHERDYERVVEERRLKLFAKYLSKIVYTFITRRNYIRQKKGVTKIQSVLRGYMMRKRFLLQRRRNPRVLHMQPLMVPKLDPRSLLIFTVFDNVKNLQLFRLDRQYERLSEEGFIIPGMPTNVNFVLTLVGLEAQHHMIIGQATFSLRDVNPYISQDINFSLTGNIVVCIVRRYTRLI